MRIGWQSAASVLLTIFRTLRQDSKRRVLTMYPTMNDLFEHLKIENNALDKIGEAVREILNWQVDDKLIEQKFSTLEELATTYASHLTRLFGIEEQAGGSMADDFDHPELAEQFARLLAEHDELRDEAKQIARAFDVSDSQEPLKEYEKVCLNLQQLLKKVDRHNQREVELLQSAWNQEIGGGGGGD